MPMYNPAFDTQRPFHRVSPFRRQTVMPASSTVCASMVASFVGGGPFRQPGPRDHVRCHGPRWLDVVVREFGDGGGGDVAAFGVDHLVVDRPLDSSGLAMSSTWRATPSRSPSR